MFASTFAMFATARCLDQIRNTICYSQLNVKIVATHGGITVGEDGASHQALEDIAYMRAIPDMTVIVPADCTEVNQVIEYAANTKGPMYIRIPRTNLKCLFDDSKYKFNPVSGVKLKDGKDLTFVSNGETLAEVICAAEKLKESGIEAEIIHYPVVKPFYPAVLIESASKTKNVVVVPCRTELARGGTHAAQAALRSVIEESGVDLSAVQLHAVVVAEPEEIPADVRVLPNRAVVFPVAQPFGDVVPAVSV